MCRRLTFEQLVQLLVLVLLFAAIFGLFAAVLALGHAVQQTMQQTGRAIQGCFNFHLQLRRLDWVLIRVAFAVKTVQFVVSHAVV
ncbi:hypothetical protein AK812_SmicGene41893 [Symbiodinium microadriaticum]|uniref:Uncharacterized protein n=1 Tax=Symbiodinium microadriaticum TaxID=2951 RepID=A0A1Q9C4Y0_SYMMI|nr:hypothetical protein AK812_SmicGene41893 [Symbiodinium microadriaticum]